mmetsp:Transcript_88875/g.153944  ORF Transcript_88875/g.153944 Transcript_88875/m.153944 type:complete len:292 (+) Transcript_88875:67-942(+)
MLETAAVYINGFDFGTTSASIEAHMGQAGTVVSVQMQKGSAVVTFASAEEANYAVSTLDKSTIAGNSRFIDVQIDKKSLPPKAGDKRGYEGGGSSTKVLVKGFDFDTTDEQFQSHMSQVGTIEEIFWHNKGSANVVYSSAEEATAAIKDLHGTTIKGNTRFIDVIIGGDRAFDRAAKRFKGGGKGWEPIPVWKGKGGAGKGKGKGKKGDHSDEDPANGGRVFVRGFDFGTSDEQLQSHMSKVGPIHTIHWVNKGNAVVVYKSKMAATKAVNTLNESTIPGNSRYINVTPRT